MSKYDDVYKAWSIFCDEQEACEKCPYGDEVHCSTAYVYDAGIKYAYDAAVNLIGSYKEVKHD